MDCLLEVLEEVILQQLQSHMFGENIAIKTRRRTGKRKPFCALISFDMRNAFNTARWKNCIEAIMRKKAPDYLLRIMDDNLSNRWVIYEGEKWSLKDEMTCGAPQG